MTPTSTATPGGATALFSTTFDSQGTGALLSGSGASQFSGTSGASRLSVQTAIAASTPNALAVSIAGGGSAYASKQYASGYTQHTLAFKLQLGSDVVLPTGVGDYVVLAQVVPSTASSVGKVNVTLSADEKIRLDYYDSAGTQHSLYGTTVVTTGAWHTVAVRETVGAGTGSLTLLLDGATVASGTSLDLGSAPLTWFAVGDKSAPSDANIAGHLYVDDVTATSP